MFDVDLQPVKFKLSFALGRATVPAEEFEASLHSALIKAVLRKNLLILIATYIPVRIATVPQLSHCPLRVWFSLDLARLGMSGIGPKEASYIAI